MSVQTPLKPTGEDFPRLPLRPEETTLVTNALLRAIAADEDPFVVLELSRELRNWCALIAGMLYPETKEPIPLPPDWPLEQTL